nr:ABC transporter substrate-binding protein [Kineococcus siccus]
MTVATDASYAPMEYLEGSRPAGVDIDLAEDLGRRLGLEVTFRQVAFDDLIATVSGHQADVIMSSMTDRASRQADVDFVDYFVAGSQVLTAGGNPAGLSDPASWCGRTAAVNSSTTNGDLVAAQSALCTAAGSPAVRTVEVDNGRSGDAVLAGAADFGVEDYPSAADLATASGGRLELVGESLESAPYGIATAKDRTALRDAVQVALQESIADGSYAAVLERHGVGAAALRTTAINGGA